MCALSVCYCIGGCPDLSPETYTDLDKWEAEADTSKLWFLKQINSTWFAHLNGSGAAIDPGWLNRSRGVTAVRSVAEVRSNVGIVAAGEYL